MSAEGQAGTATLPAVPSQHAWLARRATLRRYQRLARYALQRWPALLVILVLSVLASGVAVLQPWPLKILVDYGLGDATIPPAVSNSLASLGLEATGPVLVVVAGLASLALFALNACIEAGLSLQWTAAGQGMVVDLARDLYAHMQRLSLTVHHRFGTGDFLSRLSEDTYCVYAVVERLLVSPVQQIITLAMITVVAWHLDPQLTLIAFAIAPIMAGFSLLFGKPVKRHARETREAQSRLLAFVHQTLSALPVVQAFGTEQHNQRRFQRLANDVVEVSQRSALIRQSFSMVNGLIITIGVAAVIFFGGLRVLSGEMTVGSLLVFLGYLRTMQSAFQTLFGTYGNLKYVEASVDRVSEVLEMSETVTDRPDAKALSSPANGAGLSVSFQNVTFGYDPGRPVLHEITLELHPGETVALVGATGAGKSSLAALIPRLFDPQDGIVLVDDTDIRTVKLSSLARAGQRRAAGSLLAPRKRRRQHRLWPCGRRRARRGGRRARGQCRRIHPASA